MAATSLVGQALGRRDRSDAMRWGWEVSGVGAAVLFTLGLPMLLAPDALLGGFLSQPSTIESARLPLMLYGGCIVFDGLGQILMHALQGAGANRQTLLVSVAFQWGLLLPAAYLLGPVLGHGLLGIWVALVAQRSAQAAFYAVMWRRGAWQAIRV